MTAKEYLNRYRHLGYGGDVAKIECLGRKWEP